MYCSLKPGFHIVVSVVSVVSVVRKKFIGQLQLYGNLPYKCSIQKKRQIQVVVRDKMNYICPMNFFRSTDTTDTTIWELGLIHVMLILQWGCTSKSMKCEYYYNSETKQLMKQDFTSWPLVGSHSWCWDVSVTFCHVLFVNRRCLPFREHPMGCIERNIILNDTIMLSFL